MGAVRRLARWLPVAATICVAVLAALLPVAIFLTAISFQWLAFLVGVLVAASLALASRASRARWLIARRDAQLRSLRARFAREVAARVQAQERLAAIEEQTRLATPRQMEGAEEAPAQVLDPPQPAAPAPQPGREQCDAAARIAAALADDHFSLYMREVARIRPGASVPEFHEVLLRLDEEDDYHLPPGAFLALAEDCGMLPALDAWQVARIVAWIAGDPARRMETWSVSVSIEALSERAFVSHLHDTLRAHRVAARCLCIGVGTEDLRGRLAAALPGLRELAREGCRIALNGFSGGPAFLEMLREVAPDYLRIDGGIVLGITRSQQQASRVAAINRVAHAHGVSTVAECVEDTATIERLMELGVDFAQGSAISGWQPLHCDRTLAPGGHAFEAVMAYA